MDAYLYQAALYCPDCARTIKKQLAKEGKEARDYEDEHSFDSREYPKGPFAEGGGESDSPEHCDACRVFLENPLTGDGVEYVKEAVREDREERKHGDKANPATGEWAEFYGIHADAGDEEDDREEMQEMLGAHGLDPSIARELQEDSVEPVQLATILENPDAMRSWDLRLLRPLDLHRGDEIIVHAYRAGPGHGLAYGKFRGALYQDLRGKNAWDVVEVERASDAELIEVYVLSIDPA